jgi:hypothetical protein
MWTWVLIIGLLSLGVLVAKLVERRAGKDGAGDEDMRKIMRGRMGRGDSSGPMPFDGGGWGDGGGGGS